jgi:hypothetical protein
MEILTEKEARQVILALGMTPDSLRSPLMKKLEMIVYEHCVVKDKRLEVTISEKEFKAIRVPEIYYDILQKEVADLNHFLDTTTSIVFNADSVICAFKKSQDEYFAKKIK